MIDKRQQWHKLVNSQLLLGITPEKINYLEANNSFTEQISEKEFSEYLNQWNDLTKLQFILPFFDHKIIEIQGHGPTSIDILTTENKFNIDPDLQKLEWENLLLYFCLKSNIEWNTQVPFVSFFMTIMSKPCRLSLTHKSLTGQKCHKLFIRLHQNTNLDIKLFYNINCDYNSVDWLKKTVNEKSQNILICGPTGAGKTTFLKSLCHFANEQEHIVCIEDTEELLFEGPRITSLIAKDSHNMNQLCHYAMRMSPDRIILGEIRGKEIIPLSLMLNTGHQGLLATVHSSSAETALHRLALLFCLYQVEGTNFHYQYALKFLAQQFHHIIYMENKKIKKIINVLGAEQDNIFYEDQFVF